MSGRTLLSFGSIDPAYTKELYISTLYVNDINGQPYNPFPDPTPESGEFSTIQVSSIGFISSVQSLQSITYGESAATSFRGESLVAVDSNGGSVLTPGYLFTNLGGNGGSVSFLSTTQSTLTIGFSDSHFNYGGLEFYPSSLSLNVQGLELKSDFMSSSQCMTSNLFAEKYNGFPAPYIPFVSTIGVVNGVPGLAGNYVFTFPAGGVSTMTQDIQLVAGHKYWAGLNVDVAQGTTTTANTFQWTLSQNGLNPVTLAVDLVPAGATLNTIQNRGGKGSIFTCVNDGNYQFIADNNVGQELIMYVTSNSFTIIDYGPV